MSETVVELFIQIFFDLFIKKIGTAIRWIFYNDKYTFKELYHQNWNNTVGFITLCLVVVIIVKIFE